MPEEAAISGIDDASQVRVRLLQSGRAVHTPLISLGGGLFALDPSPGDIIVWDGSAWVSSGAYATGRRNRVVNGAMQISQENGTTAAGTHAYYVADQWQVGSVHGGVHSARSLLTSAPGARTAAQFTCTTADAALAAADELGISQRIEGNRLADFYWGDAARAKAAVLRFTAYANNVGTYCVSLRNNALDASFVAAFTLPAGVWTEVAVAVPPCTLGTAWPYDNTRGGFLSITVMCGSTGHAPTLNTWLAGDYSGHASMTNFMATVGNDFRFTNVGLYLDDSTGIAPKWEMPDEAEELQACQRYFYMTDNNRYLWPYFNDFTYRAGVFSHPTMMRTSPTITGTLAAAASPSLVQTLTGGPQTLHAGASVVNAAAGCYIASGCKISARM